MMYATLQPANNEIRLLTISPGALDDDIVCDLNVVSMKSDPSYIALSYCWGDEKSPGYVTVNNHKTSVTQSLKEALRYLRSGKNDVVVWADAICINQKDDEEKSSQIGYMGKIYAQGRHGAYFFGHLMAGDERLTDFLASYVWIWLGNSDESSETAMAFLNSVQELDFEDPTFQPKAADWQAVKALLLRPWWSRMWIIQEALLAQKATLNCGSKSTALDNIVYLKEVEVRYRRRPEERLKHMQSGLSCAFSTILSDWKRLKDMVANGGMPLFQAVTISGKAQCQKKIDKIYALLGICNEADRQLVEVDTSLSFPTMMARIAKTRMSLRKKWNPLMVLQTHQAGKDPELPTWVPDWTTDDFEHHLIFPPSQECRPYVAAALNSSWTPLGLAQLSPDEDEVFRIEQDGLLEALVLSGLVVDSVSLVFAAPTEEFYEGSDLEEDRKSKLRRNEAMVTACKKWEACIQDIPPEDTPYQDAAGRYDAFWRTLIADRDYDWKGPIPEERDFAGRFEAWMGRTDMAGAELEMYCRPFSDAAIIHCMYRSFIVTEKGYFGLGRQNTRPGDEVCILRGGCVPFMLRQRDEKYHELGGEVYLHGVIDGRFVLLAKKEELKEFRIC